MRISDWSSDVCSSDLLPTAIRHAKNSAEGAHIWKVQTWITSTKAISSSTRRSRKRSTNTQSRLNRTSSEVLHCKAIEQNLQYFFVAISCCDLPVPTFVHACGMR